MINPAANNWIIPLREESWMLAPGSEPPLALSLLVLDMQYGNTPIYDSMKLWWFKRFNRMTCVELRELHRTLRLELYHTDNKRKLINNLTNHFMRSE